MGVGAESWIDITGAPPPVSSTGATAGTVGFISFLGYLIWGVLVP